MTAQPPAGSWMMNTPGAVQPNAPVVVTKKKYGLVPVRANSGHMIEVGGKDSPKARMQVTARDPLTVPSAKSVYICLHGGCAGKSWKDEAAMRTDHPDPRVMEKGQQVHLYACYSNDPIDAKDKDAGCIGLIAPPTHEES